MGASCGKKSAGCVTEFRPCDVLHPADDLGSSALFRMQSLNFQPPRTPGNGRWLRHFWALALLAVFRPSDAAESKRRFSIPAGSADTTLQIFLSQADIELVYTMEKVEGVRTNPVQGEYTSREVLSRMVSNTDLTVVEDARTGALMIDRSNAAQTPSPPPPESNPQENKARSAGHRNISDQPMNTDTIKRRNPLAVIVGWLTIALAPAHTVSAVESNPGSQSQAALGTITGVVTNVATGRTLEGARVTIAGTGREVLTDNRGAYHLANVPPGSLTLSVSYTGLDTRTVPVSVAAGVSANYDIELTAEIYKMSQFVVSGEREGNALAITMQRNSTGVRSIASADAFGSLDGNPADLLVRLPGVSGTTQDGDFRFVQIRGMSQQLSTITRDGNRMASGNQSGSREFQFLAVSSESIERFEVVKSPTPDMDADSIGGAVNMVTKSAFDRKPAGRRIDFSAGGVWRALDSRDNVPRRNYTIGYSEVFGDKIGVTLNYSHRKHFSPLNGTFGAFENKVADPAYRYSFTVHEFRISRDRWGGDIKLDYKLSDNTRFYLTSQLSKHVEYYNIVQNVYTTNQAIATRDAAGNLTGTGGIVPGYTTMVTDWRPVAATNVQTTGSSSDNHRRTIHSQIGAVHKFKNLDIDYDIYKSNGQNISPGWGRFGATARNVGLRFDAEDQPFHLPKITQTAGPDITNINSYTENSYLHVEAGGKDAYLGGAFNLKKHFETDAPSWIKVGFRERQQERVLWNYGKNATYVGPDGVMGVNPATGINDDNLAQFVMPNARPFGSDIIDRYPAMPTIAPTGKYAPDWGLHKTDFNAGTLWNDQPGLFRESIAANIITRLTNDQYFEEKIRSGYVMGNVDIGRFSALGGVRVEETRTMGEGALQYISPEERARRAAWVGPVTDAETIRRTTAEYSGRREASGEYRDVFPGVHFKYEPMRGLIARASYASNIGRPNIGQLIPRTTVNDENQTISASNPGLKPQFAQNFDLSLEYYFEPVGQLTAGLFRKEMKQFIYTQGGIIVGSGADNGFDGQYTGYSLSTQQNGGFATVEGFELAYQQQFTFLPGWLSGLGVHANYTKLESKGNYGSAVVRSSSEVEGFVPESGSFGISYIKDRITTRLQMTYAGRFLRVYSTSQARLDYARPQTLFNIKTVYRVSKQFDVYLDVNNMFNEADRDWEYYGGRPRYLSKIGSPQFVFGVTGRL